MPRDAEIARILDEGHEEYRRLAVEHKSLDEKVAEMESKGYLTPEEDLERNKLKKLKLKKKDRMAEIVREYKSKN